MKKTSTDKNGKIKLIARGSLTRKSKYLFKNHLSIYIHKLKTWNNQDNDLKNSSSIVELRNPNKEDFKKLNRLFFTTNKYPAAVYN